MVNPMLQAVKPSLWTVAILLVCWAASALISRWFDYERGEPSEPYVTGTMLHRLAQYADDYEKRGLPWPTGGNASIMLALEKTYGGSPARRGAAGEALDAWGQPLVFELDLSSLRIYSLGNDGREGGGDDLEVVIRFGDPTTQSFAPTVRSK